MVMIVWDIVSYGMAFPCIIFYTKEPENLLLAAGVEVKLSYKKKYIYIKNLYILLWYDGYLQ